MSRTERVRRKTFIQRTAIWIPAGVIGLLMLPLAVTSRTFGDDWTLHLWLLRQQELNIQANKRPGLFVSASPLGVFYPVFAFTGSGLYTVGGYLALLLGGRPILAYKLLYLIAVCMAYGGASWLSWLFGLRGWRGQIPGLVFVTGTYFVTDMFGRGDLGELMAISALPLLIAAVTAVAISPRLRPLHLLGVAGGVFALTGSHNITLLYGTIFITVLALVVCAAHGPRDLLRLPWLRLPALGAAAVIGIGLNAWYLFPDIHYGLHTNAALRNQPVPTTGPLHWRALLDPIPRSDPSHIWSPDIRLSLPWLFALWAVVVGVVAWRLIDRAGRRAMVLLTAVACVYVVLITSQTPWKALPHSLYNIQFTWRLHSYVLLATTLLVMLTLVWHARSPDSIRLPTSVALAALVVFSVGAATWQIWSVRSLYHSDQREIQAPRNFADTVLGDQYTLPASWYGGNDFRVVLGPIFDLGFAHQLNIPEAGVRGSAYTGLVDVRVGPLPFRTNISAGPQLATITGITPIGITSGGFIVAERTPGTPLSGPVAVTIRQASTRLLRTGTRVSRISLYALVVLLAWTVVSLLWPLMATLGSGLRRYDDSMRTRRSRRDVGAER